MCDLNWCPVCDKAISCESDSLYCSLGCLRHDANNRMNHDFHNFLAPKSCSTNTIINRRFSLQTDEESLPELSAYTNSIVSTASSSSIFTRRADLRSRGLLKVRDQDQDILSCCDYCENLKSTSPASIKSRNVPFMASPINLTIK